MSRQERKALLSPGHEELSLVRQCQLLGLNRASVYYRPRPVEAGDVSLMRLIDEQFLKTPVYGSRRMTAHLQRAGHLVNRKRVQRLMAMMGLLAIHPGPKTSIPHPEQKIYPYLLRDVVIDRPNQVWSTDPTYLPLARGFMYLVAILDRSLSRAAAGDGAPARGGKGVRGDAGVSRRREKADPPRPQSPQEGGGVTAYWLGSLLQGSGDSGVPGGS
ncbi:MAG: IS3 family transposase [Magnetococcales bacterium]|nr:IS3 family transposase [Magnetococcales bacterium]